MSKFFQALENAEKERREEASASAEVAPPRPAAAPERREDTPKRGPVVVPRTETTAPPRPATIPAPIMTATAPALVHVEEAPAATAVAEAPAPSADRRADASERRADASEIFGARIARTKKNGRRAHAGVFTGSLPGATAREAGQLDDHLVSLLEPTSYAAEQYRTVRLAIENFRRERGLHVVAISSPGRGEGKTISAINLAGALAQSPDGRVVLVDADLRHPRVGDYLGLTSAAGLSSFLLDSALDVDQVTEKPSSIAFSVIPAGAVSSMPYELLKSPRLSALFGALRTKFDYVVVDTPPVLAFPDVGILRDAVDGFVLVVRANRTPREGLVDGLDTIGRHRVLGLVFNDDGRNGAIVAGRDPDNGWRKYFSFKPGDSH